MDDYTINERVGEVRTALKMTRPAFGERIGVSFEVIKNVERNFTAPSAMLIKSVEREFNVSPEWLEHGTGDMFVSEPAAVELAELFGRAISEATDPRRIKLLKSIFEIIVDIPEECMPFLAESIRKLGAAMGDDQRATAAPDVSENAEK